MEVRRIEVKGYTVGNPIQLEHSEWTKAQHLGDTYWLYVVWDPSAPDARLVKIQNPFQHLEHSVKLAKSSGVTKFRPRPSRPLPRQARTHHEHQPTSALIEDYLPIEAISAEASREKSVRKGHISTLHLWWARRPLVACRAAVYGALVPHRGSCRMGRATSKKKSLGRANAAKFVERLCKYPGDPKVIAEAQRHILEAHAERLTRETGKTGHTSTTSRHGRAPRPKVLDMFAGGGAIPLEALRLGCEAYALDLNPVAHIIQLCTLVYPQKYGKPDSTARGMTGPKTRRRNHLGRAGEGSPLLGRVGAEEG